MPKPDSQNKDQAQVLKESYDPSLERIRVDALVTDGMDALVINNDGSINVNVTSEITGTTVSKIVDGTTPDQYLTVNADGSLNITDNGSSITVDATDLDIRDLDSSQDSIEVLQSTHDNLNTNANLQINDIDVSNSNPVPINDSGGSITVDAIDLDIRDLAFVTDKIDASGSTVALDASTLTALESITVQNGSGGSAVNIQDGGNSITVDSTDLDIRDLTHSSDSVKIGDGTDFLAVNTDGSINAVILEDPGTEIVNYNTSSALAANGTSNHDWTSAATSKLFQVIASASGRLKIQVQIETGAATNTFNTIAVGFNSTATPNIDINLAKYAAVSNGAKVRVIRTNLDNQAMDVYSTIIAVQG